MNCSGPDEQKQPSSDVWREILVKRLLAAKCRIAECESKSKAMDLKISYGKTNFVMMMIRKSGVSLHDRRDDEIAKDVQLYLLKSGRDCGRLLIKRPFAFSMLFSQNSSLRWAAAWAFAFRWPAAADVARQYLAIAEADPDVSVRLLALFGIRRYLGVISVDLVRKVLWELCLSDSEPTDVKREAHATLEYISRFTEGEGIHEG